MNAPARARPEAQDPAWVSKTDVTRYLRCPYTYWRLYSRMVGFEDTVSPFAMDLIQAGVEFEDQVTSAAIQVPTEMWWDGVWAGSVGYSPPTLRNEELKLFGRPDGLTSARGMLVPLEIKSHKRLRSTDEIELAFYWLLLQPYQRRRTRTPMGQLVLRTKNGAEERVSVTLPRARLEQAQELVEKVRLARTDGVEPRACACQACRWDPDIERLLEEQHHVSLVYGVGSKYTDALAELGITTYDNLLDAETESVSSAMCDIGYRAVTPDEVRRWQRHAESYVSGEPVFFGSPIPVGDHFIALDAEYDDDEVWLVGLCVSRRGRLRYHAIWADSVGEQREAVEKLLGFLTRHHDLPVVTWAGKGADIPTLRRHLKRLELDPSQLEPLVERHVDAFDHVWRSLRFPAYGLNQKDVERYLGVKRAAPRVHDGFDAVSAYRRYRRLPARSGKRAALRDELVAYNRADLRGLVRVVERLKEGS